MDMSNELPGRHFIRPLRSYGQFAGLSPSAS